MKQTLILSAVLALIVSLLPLAAPVQAGPENPGREYIPDEVIVKFKPGANAYAVAQAMGGKVDREEPLLGVIVLKVPAGAVEKVVAALSRNPNVEYAEPNGIATIWLDPNDPYDNTQCYNSSRFGCVTQWGWAKIQAYQAWDLVTGSNTVKIAVVDTGIDNSHPDLPAVVLQKDFINNDNNAEDDNGHGTHVAGTIGALTNNGVGVAGTNWNVSLIAAKALDATGSGSYTAIANAIIWAADNGAKVINLSLGGSVGSTTLQNAVNYAWNKGAVLACAAGNNGTKSKSYPAAYTNCIAVAATDQNDAKASFSQYGSSWVDVAAPGVAILSTMPDTPVYLNTAYGYYTTYDALNGTSMATPHVAGLAGLVWATGKCSTASCVRNRIEQNADAISGTGTYWYWGRINAYRAVSAP
ncbi:MAG: S8 family peptidase [Anaerolineae bacterium]|nr:S8 family peptidase [Anaerolineae bacterium]